MENGFGYGGRRDEGVDKLAQQLSALAVTDGHASSNHHDLDRNANDGLFQVMKAVEAAEATIKQQVEENNRLRFELHKKIQELEKYKSVDTEDGYHHAVEHWTDHIHLLQRKRAEVSPLMNQSDGIGLHGSPTIALQKDRIRNVMSPVIRDPGEGHTDSSKINGTLQITPGNQPEIDKAGIYQFSSLSSASLSPSRYQLEGDYDPQFDLSGHGLVPIADINNSSISLKQDVVNAWDHEQEISQLRKHLTDYSIKEAQICNEKYALEKRIAYMRMAFDQQQQDLVDAASKALSYRQGIIEENIRLTYALQDAQEERSTFVTCLMPLLAEYSLQPPVADAQSIASNIKVLFRHLQEKLLVTEAKLKESHYQLAVWRSDVNTNFAQSPFHSTGKNGLELVPQRAYADGQMPISSDPLQSREWDMLGHQNGLGGGIGRNLEPNDLGRYSPLASRNTTSLGVPAQLDVDRGNMHPAHKNEETINKQVTFSDLVSTNDIDDVELEGSQNEGEALVNWASKSSAYTTALEDPSSSYSPYLPPVLEEPSSSFSEAADEDPLPAVESLQITGEAFPGRELQASGYSLNGTTSCNFEWVRHMEDGSVNYIDGAKQPNYLVTADDVDTYLAIEVQPMDNRKRKGELVKVFANEHRKIMCDPEMQMHIEKTLYSGHASYKLSLSTGSYDIWEPATLAIKRDGYSIKGSVSSGAVVTEKFSPSTTVMVPCENPVEFSIIGSGGVERQLRAEDNTSGISRSRDTIVLTLRFFIKRQIKVEHQIDQASDLKTSREGPESGQAGDKKKGKKRGLFFNK